MPWYRFSLAGARFVVLALLFTALAVTPAWAKSKKKKSSAKSEVKIDYLQRLIAAEKEDAAAAAKAKAAAEQKLFRLQSQLGAAEQNVLAGKGVLEQRALEISGLRSTLEAVEKRIVHSQTADSPYQRLQQAWADAREKLADARKRVLESSDYQARFEKPKSLADAARTFGKSEAEALKGDAAYRRAELELRAAETLYHQHKTELFLQDGEWQKTTAALRQLLPQLAEDKELQAANNKKVSGAKISLRSTAAIASEAHEAEREHKANIKAAAAELSKLTKKRVSEKYDDKKQDSKSSGSSNSSSSSSDGKKKDEKK